MKIVLTCGHPDSGLQFAHAALVAAGLAQAQRSRRESISPAEFHERIFKAYDQDVSGLGATKQISPGKIWEELATDIFMANMSNEAWGWADARTASLLDFWKDIDPQTRFVLIYSSPEFAVGQALRNKPGTPAEIDRAIASWTASNTEILRFYNRNQNRCMLANVSAAIHTSASFVEQTANAFGLKIALDASAYQTDRSGISAIASGLAKALIEDRDEALALYRELESSANLDSRSNLTSVSESTQAWQEYLALLSEIDEAATVAKSQRDLMEATQAQLEQLTRSKDEQTQLAAGRQAQIQELTRLRDEQTKLAAERQAQIQQLTQSRDGQAKLAADRQAEITRLAATIEDVQKHAAAKQFDPAPLQTRNKELLEENELLLLQLHQVQEELEHCFLQNQEFTGKTKVAAYAGELWRRHHPAEIEIDMRDEIEGDNWYHVEPDGRWAGPGELSTLRVPALRDGKYEVRLYVVDAGDPEILSGMNVSLNGMPLEIDRVGEDVTALIYARFSTSALAASPVWEFQFKFHKLKAPALHGSGDPRKLAVRLQSLRLSSIE